LEKKGFEVSLAENGEEGLKAARALTPQLIILDCDMPVMDGPQMCQSLKDYDETHEIPVFFLTSIDTPKNIIECFQFDAAHYLSKPVNPKILLTQVQEIIEEFSSK